MGVTIVDIAKEVGVSYTTVSRALNNKKGVSDEVRKKIIKVADEMGYQPNRLARGLVSNSTKTIGLIIPDIMNPFFPEVARGLEDAASENGYTVFLTNSNWDVEKEKQCIESMVKNQVDGIIINPNSFANLELLKKLKTPVVFLNTKVEGEEVSYIGIDNIIGAKLATQHLIDCGYQKIAYIGGTLKSYSNIKRLEGYKSTLEANDMELNKKLIVNGKFESDYAYKATKKLLASDTPPDAVFAANDVIALGVLEAVDEAGLNIPEEFGIIGFDDIEETRLHRVNLSTMSLPKYFMGKKAFELLLDALKEEYLNLAQYKIKPKLVKRNTTK